MNLYKVYINPYIIDKSVLSAEVIDFSYLDKYKISSAYSPHISYDNILYEIIINSLLDDGYFMSDKYYIVDMNFKKHISSSARGLYIATRNFLRNEKLNNIIDVG